MTFVRYSRALWAEAQAKVAKAAKVELEQDVVAANGLLNPAKVQNDSTRISQTLAKLSPTKSAETRNSSRISHFSRPRARQSDASDRSTPVGQWQGGVDKLLTMSRPNVYPADEWTTMLDDAVQFIKRWAEQADRLGWKSWEVWGVSSSAPRYRFDGMGLIPLLRGQKITALTVEAAVIETHTSNRLRFYRRPLDPLRGSERVLIWELA